MLAAQSCLTLCKPMDYSLPGSSVPGILQAWILEQIAIPFSRGSSLPRDQTWVSCIGRQLLYHQHHLESLILAMCYVLFAQLCPTLQLHGLQPARLLCPWNSPGKNTGVGSHSLLQGIFPTEELNPGLLRHRQILY